MYICNLIWTLKVFKKIIYDFFEFFKTLSLSLWCEIEKMIFLSPRDCKVTYRGGGLRPPTNLFLCNPQSFDLFRSLGIFLNLLIYFNARQIKLKFEQRPKNFNWSWRANALDPTISSCLRHRGLHRDLGLHAHGLHGKNRHWCRIQGKCRLQHSSNNSFNLQHREAVWRSHGNPKGGD